MVGRASVCDKPGHNGRIVFGAVTDDGSSQLFLIGPHGHGLHQITHVNGDAVHPDWSPNGRWIAFEFDTENGCRLVVMRAERHAPAHAATPTRRRVR